MKAFDPVKDLVGSLYDVLYDAANKVWTLVKPVFYIGVFFDLVTGKLGWINQILGYYHQVVEYTSGANILVIIFLGLVLLKWVGRD